MLFAQVEVEETNFNYQIAYCVDTQNSTAWIGNNVVVMIEGESPEDRNIETMETVLSMFDDIILKFQEFTGLTNLDNLSEYNDKPVIEVVIDNCGAGGLAHHGIMGMSTGKFFLDQFYDLVESGTPAVPQVFFYELNRNFWLPAFNDKFDWAMNDEIQNWGWWTVGMNNAMAYIVPKSLDMQMHYFGTTGLEFWADRMVGNLNEYLDNDQYNFDFGWRQSLMPWIQTESINDLMSGLLIYSYKNFGEDEWMKEFYQQIVNPDIENRSDVFAYQECRDNVYKIWSLAARTDLIDFFEVDMKWEISNSAKSCVMEMLVTNTSDVEVNAKGINAYPNPVNHSLTVEVENPNIKHILLFNRLGQLLSSEKIINGRVVLDVSLLSSGLYFLEVGAEVVKVEKL